MWVQTHPQYAESPFYEALGVPVGAILTDNAEIERDLDRFLEYYNLHRSRQGYRLKGRTPAQASREALGLELSQLPAFTREDEAPQEPVAAQAA